LSSIELNRASRAAKALNNVVSEFEFVVPDEPDPAVALTFQNCLVE
jgi:hypothetical protein